MLSWIKISTTEVPLCKCWTPLQELELVLNLKVFCRDSEKHSQTEKLGRCVRGSLFKTLSLLEKSEIYPHYLSPDQKFDTLLKTTLCQTYFIITFLAQTNVKDNVCMLVIR